MLIFKKNRTETTLFTETMIIANEETFNLYREREDNLPIEVTSERVVESVSGSGVTSQKINRVRYYVEARSALRRGTVGGRGREGGRRRRDGEYSALHRAVSLPVIFARFYGNLRIIQLGPGDHFPRYANSTVRPATRRTVLTTVVGGGMEQEGREIPRCRKNRSVRARQRGRERGG